MIRLLGQQWLHGMFFTEPNSTQAAETDNLFMFILWVTIISFVGVVGAMIWFVIRYRRKPGVPTQRSPSHHTVMELAWSIGPLIPLVFIFFWGFESYLHKRASPANAEVISIVGQKWSWAPRYDNGGTPRIFQARTKEIDYERTNKSAPVIIVPKGKPVKLLLESKDVIHAFFIPDFRTKIDVIPNRTTTMWFTALEATKRRKNADGSLASIKDEKGKDIPLYEDHVVFCAEYCGDNHSEMAAYIRVLEPDEYEREKATLTSPPPGLTPPELGKFLWVSLGCRTCHTIDGKPGTGPTWQNIWGGRREFSNAPPIDLTTDEAFINYVRESLETPGAKLVKTFGNQMPSFKGQIPPEYFAGIIAFMQSAQVSPAGPKKETPVLPQPPADAPAEGVKPPSSPAENRTPAAPGENAGGVPTGGGGSQPAKPASP